MKKGEVLTTILFFMDLYTLNERINGSLNHLCRLLYCSSSFDRTYWSNVFPSLNPFKKGKSPPLIFSNLKKY